ncbi:semaphorin-3D-like [Oncorhynchus clarkii lewisi]|uniref:semaphorin-3D-like n=1 Tax=Oncorhynchus clarkii lewisi TaxID=490388 RepID=UPI0039B99C7B
MKMRILGPERFCVLLGVSLQLLLLLPDTSSTAATWSQSGPRLQLSHTELHWRNSSSVFWDRGVSGGYQALLLDEDRGWLLVGGRDHVYLLHSNSLDLPTRTIYWPAATEHVEHCRLAGKNLSTDCANYVRLLQPFNKTHVYVCGTGAYHPQCTYIDLGRSIEEPSFRLLSHAVESGRGKCPFSPREPFTARLTDGDLYAGTSVDFMGTNTAIFRTSVHSSKQHYIRTEAYQDHWLNEPEFVGSFSIPDTHSVDDDKVYIFFKETAVESSQWDKRVYNRVARVCKNDVGGKRSLINRWSTFLKARLVCSVPGPAGLDTQFDELEDVFMLETKDSQNPIIYGVFSTSSSVFRGSAVCVYSMASIRAAFNGPFAHKEGPDYRWVEYKGRIPYPRPGTCPSVTYDPLHKSTRDFPDDVVSFMRGHHLMWEPILPVTRRPVFTLVNVSYTLRKLVVDRVDAADGQYDVLHLGTDDGQVLKVVSIPKENREPEEIILEQLTVFQNHAPILSMELSTKRQQLYVSSDEGVAQLPLQRCELYGKDCADCCLARDPYCVWDGNTCNRYFPSNKRRARRQDVKHGDSMSQCHNAEDGSESVELKVIYGVQSSSTFLECMPRSQQATVKWTVQPSQTRTSRELLQSEDRMVHMKQGLLVQRLEPGDAGLYSCTTLEHSFSQVQARYDLQVIPQQSMTASQARASDPGAGGAGLRGSPGGTGSHTQRHTKLLRNYKDLHMVGMASMSATEYCEQLWYREKKKLRQLKWKQTQVDNGKARVRRHDSTPLQ